MRILGVGSGSIPVSYACAVTAALGHEVTALIFENTEPVTVGPVVNGEPVAVLHTSAGVRRTVLERRRRTEIETLLSDRSASSSSSRFAEISRADVVVSDDEGISLAAREGGFSVVCVTPFGIGSPKSRWRLTGPSLFHMGGLGIVTPRAAYHGESQSGPPQAPFGSPLEYLVGLYAAFAMLASKRAVQKTFADISMLDCLLPLTRRETAAWQFDHYRATRKERLWKVGPSGFYACADGYFYLHVVEDRQWQKLCSSIGAEQLLVDTRFATALSRFENERVIDDVLIPWASDLTRETIFEILGSAGIPCGPVLTAIEARRLSERIDARLKWDARAPWVTPLPIRMVGGSLRWLGAVWDDESQVRVDQ